jgi:hypothetical protein
VNRILLLGIVVLSMAGCAATESMPAAPPTVDVTGSWAGQWAYTNASLGGGQINMTVKQAGAKLSGDMQVTGTPMDRSGPVSGLVSGNQIQILYPTSVTGRLTVQGDTMSGQIDGLNPANMTMKKVK